MFDIGTAYLNILKYGFPVWECDKKTREKSSKNIVEIKYLK